MLNANDIKPGDYLRLWANGNPIDVDNGSGIIHSWYVSAVNTVTIHLHFDNHSGSPMPIAATLDKSSIAGVMVPADSATRTYDVNIDW